MAFVARPRLARAAVLASLGLSLGFAACGDEDESPADNGLDGGAPSGTFDGGTLPGTDGSATTADAAASADAGQTNGGADLPCAVKQVLDKHCSSCHVAGGLGGFPLATLADLKAPLKGNASKTTFSEVAARISEPTSGTLPMPPLGYERPSADEIATVTNWVNGGAQAGAACGGGNTGSDGGAGVGSDGGGGADGIDTSGLTCYKLLAHPNNNMNGKFKVGVATDAYFNMTFAAPWQGTVYAQVIRPIIDNKSVIHHWLLFKGGSSAAPGSVEGSSGAHPGGELMYGWAPGGDPFDFRSAGSTGYELSSSTTYTMEYHYNSSDASAEDASGIEICVSPTKPTNLVSQSWLGYDLMPPAAPRETWTGTCRPSSNQRIHIIAVSPHMHKQGNHMTGIINRANGTKETLHDLDFDFEYQKMYPKDVWLEPGDTITTTCTYDKPMRFGSGTEAEMCYLFTMAYPAGALSDNGYLGRFAHGDNACLGQ